jgi:hypothetical protein
VGPNHGSNVGQNAEVRGIARKHGLTSEEGWLLSELVHSAKKSGAYDLDINGNLLRADIEAMAEEIVKARGG